MGASSAALYADDTTCDVRDTYVRLLKQGASDDGAVEGVLATYAQTLGDREVACLVYFGLADTAWKYGRLPDAIKQRALALIEAGGDLAFWEQDAPADAAARRKVLALLDQRLRSPMPARRVVRVVPPKPKKIRTTAPLGTVFLLPLPNGNRAALCLVAQLDVGASVDPVFRVLDWCGPGAPTAQQLRGVQLSPIKFSSGLGPKALLGLLPKSARHNVMADLEETGLMVTPPVVDDAMDAVFISSRQAADEISAHQASHGRAEHGGRPHRKES